MQESTHTSHTAGHSLVVEPPFSMATNGALVSTWEELHGSRSPAGWSEVAARRPRHGTGLEHSLPGTTSSSNSPAPVRSMRPASASWQTCGGTCPQATTR